MARVNLEDRLFGDDRVALLGKMLQIVPFDLKNKALGLGALALLWHSSQDEQKIKATAEDIASWFAELKGSEVIERIISAMIDSGFIRQSDDKFLVRGNKDQVESIKKFRERACKGGKAKHQKKRESDNAQQSQDKSGLLEAEKILLEVENKLLEADYKQKKSCLKQANYNYNYNYNYKGNYKEENTNSNTLTATPTPEPPIIEGTPSDGVNPSGRQENLPAVLEKTEKPKKLKSAGEQSDGSKVWQAYSMAYKQRMGVEPIRNAKQNAMCSQLVQRLGVENAVKVTVFYLTHPNPYYMRTQYALGPLVQDCEGLLTQMKRGQYVTSDDAKKVSIGERSNAALERFLEKEREREKNG